MRRDRLFLADICSAADDISAFLEGVSRDAFLTNKMLQSAVLQKLIVIGEAAARVSPELRARHPGVPWAEMTAFRNIAVHAYFSINWSIVWATARIDVPQVRNNVRQVMENEE